MIGGFVIAAIALILIIMQGFHFNWSIIPISMYGHQFVFFVGIILCIAGIYLKIRVYWIRIVSLSKTIDAMVSNPDIAQIFSLVIWILLVILIIYCTIKLSERTKS